ncbi:hypothetical protein E2C01_007088 [Portunus trituberculatus]|uniref:Uncharacterized protein n=1 Tax=Portunus trituberculatus TaxID=210409 RepID=A0A5B7CZX8_PORTR|nr:hypothetical protein [Portunus trituberculatus]
MCVYLVCDHFITCSNLNDPFNLSFESATSVWSHFSTLWLVFSNTSVLHPHYLKGLYLNLHKFLRCFNGSRSRVTRFLYY